MTSAAGKDFVRWANINEPLNFSQICGKVTKLTNKTSSSIACKHILVQLYIPSIQIEHTTNKASGKWSEEAALEPIKHELIDRKIG